MGERQIYQDDKSYSPMLNYLCIRHPTLHLFFLLFYRALNDKISCISNVTRNLCGNDTAQFMDKISPGMYAPEASVNAPGCTGKKTKSAGAANIESSEVKDTSCITSVY